MLKAKGILYVPDYVINAGGLISVYYEGETREKVMSMIGMQVSKTLDRIFTLSDFDGKDTASISDSLAEKMLSEGGMLKEMPVTRAAA